MAKKQRLVPTKLKSCGVLVLRGNPVDSFLLMIHADRRDLPKGHVEPGESELECALRELEEETAIRKEDIAVDGDFRFATEYEVRPRRFHFQPIPKTTIIFLGRLLRDVEIRVTEHISFEWLDWPPTGSVQPETIDPLLAAAVEHLAGRE